MAEVVYVLCALMSLACAVLLLRAWSQRRVKLLLLERALLRGVRGWERHARGGQARAGPNTDLILFRTLPILFGLGVLLYGMIWGTR